MQNPLEFWGADDDTKKLVYETAPAYNLPFLETENENTFREIGLYLCKISKAKFKEAGFIDMDKEYAESTDKNIVEYRQQLADYPNPYCGRKAYLGLIKLEDMYEDHDGKSVKTGKQNIAGLKETKGTTGNFSGRVLIYTYENPEFATDPNQKTKTMGIDEKGNVVEKESTSKVDQNAWKNRYFRVSGFFKKETAERLTEYTKNLNAEQTEKLLKEGLYCFLILYQLTKDVYKGKLNYKTTIDDYFVMG